MGLLSSIFGAKALKNANQKAVEDQRAGYEDAKALYQPWQQAGLAGLVNYQDAIGMGNSDKAITDFQNSPLYRLQYEAALKSGQTGVANMGNAAGMRNSGRTLAALADNARDTTNRTYQQYVSPLSGMTDMGYQATGNLSNLRMGMAGNEAQFHMNKGEIKAGQMAGFDGLLMDGAKMGMKLFGV